jgi:hypothetical protein
MTLIRLYVYLNYSFELIFGFIKLRKFNIIKKVAQFKTPQRTNRMGSTKAGQSMER